VAGKTALADILHLTAPLRRVGTSFISRIVVLVIGLVAMSAYTMPDLQKSARYILEACLWFCLAYFVVECAVRMQAAIKARRLPHYLVSPSGLVDVVGAAAVPIALLCGLPSPTAWLFAALWVLKLGQRSPALAQIARVFVTEAKPLAGVFALFLIILFLSSAAMYVIERDAQPGPFGTLPAALWWAVVTLTTTGYGDAVPLTHLGHLLGAFVMICGIATFGLSTGILATGFAAENRRRNFLQTWDLVSKVPFFQTLDPSAITEITHMLRRLEVPERTILIRRGKVGDCMYFIAGGEVQVEIPPKPIRLSEGSFFGELALLGDSIRSANVTTTMPSTLLILDLADFRTLTANHPDLKRAIDEEGARRMRENQEARERRLSSGAPA
jgi:voltage-gated potassium channel